MIFDDYMFCRQIFTVNLMYLENYFVGHVICKTELGFFKRSIRNGFPGIGAGKVYKQNIIRRQESKEDQRSNQDHGKEK